MTQPLATDNPPMPGCLIDGHLGQYIYSTIVDLAQENGYLPTATYFAEVERQTINGEARHGIQATEEVIEESELATEYLNDRVASKNPLHLFDWYEGEYFYMPLDWWDECF